MPGTQMSKLAIQLLAVGVLALLSVAVAQPPTMQQPGVRRPVTIVVSEGTPKAVNFTTQAVGGTAVYNTDLINPTDKTPVGNMVWTGTYVTRGPLGKVHYLVQTEVTSGLYQGTVVASGIDAGVAPKTIIVLGGTGAFEGATGTVDWGNIKGTNGEKLYSFKLSLTPDSSF